MWITQTILLLIFLGYYQNQKHYFQMLIGNSPISNNTSIKDPKIPLWETLNPFPTDLLIMDLAVFLQNSYLSPNPHYLRMWPYLGIGSLEKSSSWDRISQVGPSPICLMPWLKLKVQTWRQTLQEGKQTQGDNICLQAREIWSRSLPHSPEKKPTPWFWTLTL